MNLITLDFGNIMWLLFGLVILGLCYRIVWMLAKLSDIVIGLLTHFGLRGIAKALLTILVSYDQQTYVKSRFILLNQVPFRFAVLWAVTFGIVVLLFILKMGRSIDSVGQPLILIATVYVGYRCLRYWLAPRKDSSALSLFNQQVKEQYPRSYSMVRWWDYLDELFAQSE